MKEFIENENGKYKLTVFEPKKNYNRMPSGYGIVQTEIMKLNISLESKGLYAYLASMTGSKQYCFPSIKTMMQDLNVSEKLVYKYLKELKNNNLIIVSKLYNDCRNNHKYEVCYIDSSQNFDNEHIENEHLPPVENEQVPPIKKEQFINNNNINNNINNINIHSQKNIDNQKSDNTKNDPFLFDSYESKSNQKNKTKKVKEPKEQKKYFANQKTVQEAFEYLYVSYQKVAKEPLHIQSNLIGGIKKALYNLADNANPKVTMEEHIDYFVFCYYGRLLQAKKKNQCFMFDAKTINSHVKNLYQNNDAYNWNNGNPIWYHSGRAIIEEIKKNE